MVSRFVNVVALLVAQGLAVAFASVAVAQATPPTTPQSIYPNPVVVVSPASLNSFDTVLPLIAAQAKVAIVCEGQPLHLTLTPKQATDLARRLASGGTSLEDTVKEVGGAYDYDAQRLSADTFLLTKRYTDKGDLPDVTFEEALASLQNILDATQNFRPAPRPEATLLDLIRATTPEERALLAQGVPVSQLPAEQQQRAWQFACDNKFQGLSGLAKVTQRLKACKELETFFCYHEYLDLPITVYQGPFALNGVTDIFALSGWVHTGTGGGTGFDEVGGVHLADDKISVAPGVQDPTTPDGPALPTAPGKLRLTLAALAEQLSARPAANGGSATPVIVESALSHKALCLAGGEFASPDSLIQAVCALYGLERHDGYTIKTVTIVTPRPTVLGDTGAIKAEISRLLPAAFRRAVRVTAGQDTSAQANGGDYSQARGNALYIVSVRRLRGIIEPLLNKSPKRQLPLPNASDEARDLVALSSLATCTQDIQSLSLPAAPYVDNFDRATFTLTQNGGDPNSFVYGFSYRGGDGRQGGTFGSMGYPQGTFGYGTTGPHMKFKIGSLIVGM